MQNKSITPDFWRHVNANTLLYLPFDTTNTKNDMSNNHRTTTQWGSVVYGTYQGVNCWNFEGQWYVQVATWNIPSQYTIIVRANNTQWYYSWDWKMIDFRISWWNETIIWFSTNWRWSSKLWQFNNSTQNKWFMFALKCNWWSGTCRMLWQWVDLTISWSWLINNQTPAAFNFWNEYNNASWTPRYFKGLISQAIMEQWLRTDADIIKHYNKLKNKYWIT